MLEGHSGKGEESTAVGISQAMLRPPDQSARFRPQWGLPRWRDPFGVQPSEPQGSAYQQIASRSPRGRCHCAEPGLFTTKRVHAHWMRQEKRKKGTRSVSAKIGMGRQKQTIPPPSFLPPCCPRFSSGPALKEQGTYEFGFVLSKIKNDRAS